MGTKQHSNYESLITFTRASAGHALRPVSYGSQLVTNGTFDSDTSNWTANGGASQTVLSIDSQRLKVTTVSTTVNAYASQELTLTAGKMYRITGNTTAGTYQHGLAVGLTAGAVNVAWTGYQSVDQNVDMVFVATQAENHISLYARTSSGGEYAFFDNISVKEVTFDQTDGTLTLFEHPDNIPRVEYDADGNRLGLLVEEQRVNRFTYSVPDDTNWGTLNASIDENQITAPDGTNTASNFIADSGSGISHFYLDTSITSGTTYTQSLFAKAKDTSWIQIAPSTGFSSGHQNFNLQTGSLGASNNVTSASITDVGNGWYRCSVTVTATSTQSGRMVFGWIGGDDGRLDTNGSFTPDGTQGVYIWGAQLEEGAFPTSYIKSNSGSTTTRSADVASVPVADFGFNASEGTFLLEYRYLALLNNQRGFSIASDGANLMGHYQNASNSRWWGLDSGVTQYNLIADSSSAADTAYKFASVYKENDFAVTQNGGTVATDTSATVPTVDTLRLGTSYAGANQLNGHIKSIKYYPRRLTNAQLQEITS